MATHLQELLRSVCWNTEWNYAVFWKLKHRDQMVLTLEDAFYNNQIKFNKGFGEAFESVYYEQVSHDPLGLAIAKMSCHVYSLGEGIVGQVVLTGKHSWIFADEQAISSRSPLELYGWQAQFSAGIKTIVVVAVGPHGVVQLGSLNKVNENLQLLTHVRYIFSSLQEPACHIHPLIQGSLQNDLQMSEISTQSFDPNMLQECIIDLDQTTNKANNSSFLDNRSPTCENRLSTDLLNDSSCRNTSYETQIGVTSASSQSIFTENSTSYDMKLSVEKSKAQKREFSNPEKKLKTESNLKNQPELNCLDAIFSCGTELHEALGPAFIKTCYPDSWVYENSEEKLSFEMPEGTESSLVTTNFGTDHLLEAVVTNFYKNDKTFKSEKSLSTCESMLTTEKMADPLINTSRTICSSSYFSIGCSPLLGESSMRSSTSAYREPLERAIGKGSKPNKKRARPGESSRPRPRDRQLIQDRIKELRELVPNGSKCSIDSLLEKTIKHMVFMQSVTKHADKLSNCATSKGCSNEQGSSWVVEVGGDMKICPIIVENLNTNGQMLIEMLCEDCDHFLEITEMVKSLGLTILKGMTDNHGDKIWMRFVVESESNRNLHRMDVLWSLVQLLQSKTMI